MLAIEKRLQQLLTMKAAELELRRYDLTTSWYKEDPWITEAVNIFEAQVKEIGRYIKEGGKLNIAECCKLEGICGLAYRRFDGCVWGAKKCCFFLEDQNANSKS